MAKATPKKRGRPPGSKNKPKAEPSTNGTLHVKRVKLADLHADPANVRLHGERNLQAIAASLKEFGQVEPLLVQKGTGKVIGGNARMQMLFHMGETEADVVELEIDDTRAAALGIALNRTAELAEWDDAALANMMANLPDEIDLDVVGFSEGELKDLLRAGGPVEVEQDEVPDTRISCPECGHVFGK